MIIRYLVVAALTLAVPNNLIAQADNPPQSPAQQLASPHDEPKLTTDQLIQKQTEELRKLQDEIKELKTMKASTPPDTSPPTAVPSTPKKSVLEKIGHGYLEYLKAQRSGGSRSIPMQPIMPMQPVQSPVQFVNVNGRPGTVMNMPGMSTYSGPAFSY